MSGNGQRSVIFDPAGNMVFGQKGKSKPAKILRKLFCGFKDKAWQTLTNRGYSMRKISNKERVELTQKEK